MKSCPPAASALLDLVAETIVHQAARAAAVSDSTDAVRPHRRHRRAAGPLAACAESLEGRRLLAVNTFPSAGGIELTDAGGSTTFDPATPYPRNVTVPATLAGHTITDV